MNILATKLTAAGRIEWQKDGAVFRICNATANELARLGHEAMRRELVEMPRRYLSGAGLAFLQREHEAWLAARQAAQG